MNVDPLIQEIKSLPRILNGVDELRARILPNSEDQLTITWTLRDGGQTEKYIYLRLEDERSNDKYEEFAFQTTDQGTSFQIIDEVSGSNAFYKWREKFIEYAVGFAGEEYAGTSNFISGEAIDGYISGAEIFIDQNFNFKKDGHEYVATTAEDGSFTIDVIGDAYECLVNRPIVANVPVGAIDSTTGEVTEAYQMILPSISDAGAAQVVISPFTTIFSEAIIKGKEEAKLKDELTQDQACGTVGNNLASEISTRITELKDSIESTYGISYETILGDFIEAGATGVVSETNAQNVAAFFIPIKALQDGISSAMTSELGLPITANITFEEEVLDMVFGGEVLSELPINFYSVYTTEPNDLGWRREVSFRANGAKVDNQGKIKAYKCLNNPASDCESLNLNLENLGNFSQDYRQTVAFYYGLGNGDSVTIGNATGLMVVDASDVKYFGESNGRDLFACGTEEQIQLQRSY